MLSTSEKRVLETYRKFGMTPHKMLCFFGPDLQKKSPALESLVQKQFLVRESFKGAFSLTREGFAAMRHAS